MYREQLKTPRLGGFGAFDDG
jgi:hypothetical protein